MSITDAWQREAVTDGPARVLRVGLMLDSLLVPAWLHFVLKELQRTEGIVICAVALESAAQNHGPAAPKTLRERAFAAYSDFDRFIFRRKITKDAFLPMDSAELLRDAAKIEVGGELGEAERTKLKDCKLDLLLSFTAGMLDRQWAELAAYGMISPARGDTHSYRSGAPLFWDMYDKTAMSPTTIESTEGGAGESGVVYRSYAATHPYSLLLSRNEIYWKTASVMARKVKQIQQTGALALKPVPPEAIANSRVHQPPSLYELARFATRAGARIVVSQFHRRLYQEGWFLAIAKRTAPQTGPVPEHGPFQVIKPPRGHFYADPCLVGHNGRQFVFFEDYVLKTATGHIGCLELDAESGAVIKNETAIKEAFHMSYPFVFEVDGTFFMVPETAVDKTIRLYRAVEFPWKWALDTVLLRDVNGFDSTVHRQDGRWWMFVNMALPGASSQDELSLYYADELRGPWLPHAENPVVSDVRRARPAGRIFNVGGTVYRPSQNSAGGYGRSMVINEVVELSPTRYVERAVAEIGPDWVGRGNKKTHTLAMNERFVVTDGATGHVHD